MCGQRAYQHDRNIQGFLLFHRHDIRTKGIAMKIWYTSTAMTRFPFVNPQNLLCQSPLLALLNNTEIIKIILQEVIGLYWIYSDHQTYNDAMYQNTMNLPSLYSNIKTLEH